MLIEVSQRQEFLLSLINDVQGKKIVHESEREKMYGCGSGDKQAIEWDRIKVYYMLRWRWRIETHYLQELIHVNKNNK